MCLPVCMASDFCLDARPILLLLNAEGVFIPINILELCSGTRLLLLEMVQSFRAWFLRLARGEKGSVFIQGAKYPPTQSRHF